MIKSVNDIGQQPANAETLEQFEKLAERNETLSQLFKVAFELGYMRGYSHCNYQQISNPNEAWSDSTFKADLDETLTKLTKDDK